MLKVVLTLAALASVPLASARPRAGTPDSEDHAVDFPEPNAFLQDDRLQVEEAAGRTQDHLKSAAEAEGEEEANSFDQWAEANGGLASEEKSNSEEQSEWRPQEDADHFEANERRGSYERRRFEVPGNYPPPFNPEPHPVPFRPSPVLPRLPGRLPPGHPYGQGPRGYRDTGY